ncbi:hypothetical protein AB5N19_04650 [Seiridium cardinale]
MRQATAELYIIVQCEKNVAKKIRKFLNEKLVREDFEPDSKVRVVGTRLIPLSSNEDGHIRVHGTVGEEETLCGLSISINRGDRCRRATCGGLIVASGMAGSDVCGHLLESLRKTMRSPSIDEDEGTNDDESQYDINEPLEILGQSLTATCSMERQSQPMGSTADKEIGKIASDSFQDNPCQSILTRRLPTFNTDTAYQMSSLRDRVRHQAVLHGILKMEPAV